MYKTHLIMKLFFLLLIIASSLAATTVEPTTTVAQTTTTTDPNATTVAATTVAATTAVPETGLTDGQIAGIVIGSFGGVMIILIVIACLVQNYNGVNNRGIYRKMRR